ncbi:MAG: hypothetical protein JJU02_13430 [Cryomorphaceae bacterium]|nr:hypothetical protein [Cryomorphaceae bacterium]
MANILVLVSDDWYLEYTKQVFYSAHRYGNWQGEYGLFVHNIPEEKLKWFRDRGIHIFNPEPLIHRDVNGWPPIVFHKCYLVHPMMKRWDKVVYMDTDVIIMRDINKLANFSGFAARKENGNLDIRGQLLLDEDLDEKGNAVLHQLKKNYKLSKVALNVGVMVFETKHNSTERFNHAKDILYRYESVLRFPEQALFNFLFYKEWKALPPVYNDYTFYFFTRDVEKAPHLQRKKRQSKILHFIGLNKPWHTDNYFHDLWTERQNNADEFPKCAQIGENPSRWTDIWRMIDRGLRMIPLYLGHVSWLAGQQLQRFWPAGYQFYKRISTK